MIDVSERGSPGWWLQKLEAQLTFRRDTEGSGWTRTRFDMTPRRPPLKLLDAYLRGEPPLPEASQQWAPVMREYLRVGRMNLAELCIAAVVHKMRPVGFRTAADDDVDGDQKAAGIFKANQLGLRCRDAFAWFLTFADSYMMVTPNPANAQLPFITQEHPFECITSDDPITGAPRAALKLFRDEDLEEDRAYVFLPGQVFVATRGIGAGQMSDWEWDPALSFNLPAGMEDVIPLRRFRNENGTGDFEPHLDTLNRINESLFDRIVVTKYQAFSMRVFAGLPMTDGDGNDIDYTQIWTQDPGSVVTLGQPTDEDGKQTQIQFFESRAVNFDPIRMAIKDDMMSFAAATSTPLHLITPDAAQGSAEGASLQRESGTYKTEDRRQRAEHALAEVMALAFRFAGYTDRVDPNQIEVIWASAERFSLSESAAAAQQLRSAGIPLETIAEEVLQLDPEQIDRMNQQLADEALRAPVTPAVTGAVSQVGPTAPGATSGNSTSAGTAAA